MMDFKAERPVASLFPQANAIFVADTYVYFHIRIHKITLLTAIIQEQVFYYMTQ